MKKPQTRKHLNWKVKVLILLGVFFVALAVLFIGFSIMYKQPSNVDKYDSITDDWAGDIWYDYQDRDLHGLYPRVQITGVEPSAHGGEHCTYAKDLKPYVISIREIGLFGITLQTHKDIVCVNTNPKSTPYPSYTVTFGSDHGN